MENCSGGLADELKQVAGIEEADDVIDVFLVNGMRECRFSSWFA